MVGGCVVVGDRERVRGGGGGEWDGEGVSYFGEGAYRDHLGIPSS